MSTHVCVCVCLCALGLVSVCVCADMLSLMASVFMLLWVWVCEWQLYSGVECVNLLPSKALSSGPYISTTIYTSVPRQRTGNSKNNESLSQRETVWVCVRERAREKGELRRGRRDSVNKRQRRFIKTPPPLTILLSFYSLYPSPPLPLFQLEERLHASVSLVFHLSLWRGEEWRSSVACNYTETSWMRASVSTSKKKSTPPPSPFKYLLIRGDLKRNI